MPGFPSELCFAEPIISHNSIKSVSISVHWYIAYSYPKLALLCFIFVSCSSTKKQLIESNSSFLYLTDFSLLPLLYLHLDYIISHHENHNTLLEGLLISISYILHLISGGKFRNKFDCITLLCKTLDGQHE